MIGASVGVWPPIADATAVASCPSVKRSTPAKQNWHQTCRRVRRQTAKAIHQRPRQRPAFSAADFYVHPARPLPPTPPLAVSRYLPAPPLPAGPPPRENPLGVTFKSPFPTHEVERVKPLERNRKKSGKGMREAYRRAASFQSEKSK